jgi:hypothetical protein
MSGNSQHGPMGNVDLTFNVNSGTILELPVTISSNQKKNISSRNVQSGAGNKHFFNFGLMNRKIL